MPATYDEIETLVQSRRLADRIVRELEATTLSRPMPYVPPPPPPALEPEELLPPPPSLPPSNIYESWSATLPIAASPAVLKKPARSRAKRKHRREGSRLHWAVLAMAVAIACGLWCDETARTNAKRQLTTETSRLAKTASAKLETAKSAAFATAKRVSARLI